MGSEVQQAGMPASERVGGRTHFELDQLADIADIANLRLDISLL